MATETRQTTISITKLLLIPALIVVLIAMNAVYNLAESWQGVISAPAGDVLYTATFDAAEEDWQLYQGRLESAVIDRQLQITVEDAGSTAYSAAKPTFSDFDLTANATAIDGPIDNGFGVVFRLTESASTCAMPLRVLCDLAEIDIFGIPLRLIFRQSVPNQTGYYLFLISSDGYYSLWRGDTTGAQRVSTWIPNDAIQQGLGAMNQIRVIGRGDTFQFFVNDTPVELCIPDDPNSESTFSGGECTGGTMTSVWTDTTYPTGRVGVVAQSTLTGGAGVIVSFDNIIVTSPTEIDTTGQST